MAFEKRKAGASTRRLERKRYLAGFIVGLIGLAAIGILVLMTRSTAVGSIAGLLLFLAMIAAMKFISRKTEKEIDDYAKLERRARKGAAAEERIGDLLRELPKDYAVFHDIESPFGNIDHVVLDKKNNVFLIETKSHRGEVVHNGTQLLIDGKQPEKDFMTQTLKNTYWLRDELKKQTGFELFIKPVLVFSNAFVKVPKPIKNVSVVNKKYLVKTITGYRGFTIGMEKTPEEVSLFTALQRLQKGGE